MNTNNTLAVNMLFNDLYFPQGGNGGLGKAGDMYCDTNQIVCPGVYYVSAVAFWLKGNRLAVKIGYYDNTGTLNWVQNDNNDSNYFHISKDETYASIAPIYVPAGKMLTGIQLVQAGNQLAYNIGVSNTDGTGLTWISPENYNQYIPGSVENIYADENSVVLPGGTQAIGFQVWEKGNRIAPSLQIS